MGLREGMQEEIARTEGKLRGGMETWCWGNSL